MAQLLASLRLLPISTILRPSTSLRSISSLSKVLNENKSQKNWERYPDLSTYDPYLDFRNNDKTLPGGNPYAKQEQVEYPVTEVSKDRFLDQVESLVYSESLGITEAKFKSLRKKALIIRRTVNMTAKGKMPTMNALVVVGDGMGSAGYGEGKGDEVASAIKKATQRAIRNMIPFHRYENRTIYHDIELKFKATKLKLFARPPGFGVRTNLYIHEICHCIGIHDLGGKISGSGNPMNVIKIFFEALAMQRTPSSIAKARGKKLVDVQYKYYGVDSKLTN